jgi:hypothetical protein
MMTTTLTMKNGFPAGLNYWLQEGFMHLVDSLAVEEYYIDRFIEETLWSLSILRQQIRPSNNRFRNILETIYGQIFDADADDISDFNE